MAHGERRGEPYAIRWEIDSSTEASAWARYGVPFALPTLAGGEYDFSDVLGERPAVLVFWASWCEPCRAEAPHLARLAKQYGGRIEVVSVSIDEPDAYADLRTAVLELALPYPVALDADGTVLAKYKDGGSIPATFVINRDGRVTYHHGNFEPGDEVSLEREVAAVAGE